MWLYFRFGVSFRDVEEMVAARGVVVSYETIRCWCNKFGRQFADGLRRRRARPGDKWHMDEVFLKINGVTHYLWRAVDQHGIVLDILVQPKRDRFAAMRFFRKLLRASDYRRPRVIVTDKLRSYGAAKRVVMPGVAHRQYWYLNNRAENSHQPHARTREANATVQIRSTRPVFCRGSRHCYLALPPSTPPTLRRRLSGPPQQTIAGLE